MPRLPLSMSQNIYKLIRNLRFQAATWANIDHLRLTNFEGRNNNSIIFKTVLGDFYKGLALFTYC
jgi:hypothetical protein